MKIQKTIVIRKKMQIKLNKRLYNKKNQYRNNQQKIILNQIMNKKYNLMNKHFQSTKKKIINQLKIRKSYNNKITHKMTLIKSKLMNR